MTRILTSTTPVDSVGKKLFLFEKEKGGTGSTGSLVSAAHSYIMRGMPIILIEASLTQNDVLHAYAEHQRVVLLDLTASNAQSQLVDIVDSAPPGARILANIPGGRIEEVEGLHTMLNYAKNCGEIVVPTNVIWTMGLDAASLDTLEVVLVSNLPGPLILNLPRWHGDREAYDNVTEELVIRVEAIGGTVVQMPAMPRHLYDQFRKHEIAPDQQILSATMGSRIALALWKDQVLQATGHVFA
jgi:hypothetical protein